MAQSRHLKVDREQLRQLVTAHPDVTLAELRELLGVLCALSTICIALGRMGFTFKNGRFMRPNSIVRMSRHGVTSGVSGPNMRMVVD